MLVLDFLVGGFGNKAPPISLDPLDVSGFTGAYILHKISHLAAKLAQKKTQHHIFLLFLSQKQILRSSDFCRQRHIENEQICVREWIVSLLVLVNPRLG